MVMAGISVKADPNVIAGFDGAEDAGVYRISDDTALVQTLDFMTPIVDDPFTFGRISAANSLSDVYAMGGRPLTALNIVCFPTKKFTLDILSEILKGGLSTLEEAGVQLLGGHSVDDPELKYGLSVTGIVDPRKVIKNRGAKPGEAVILVKPLGTGIVGTAVKAGIASDDIIKPFIESMTLLNKRAAEIMTEYPVSAATDVTGFGLAGHLKEMIGADNLRALIYSAELPLLPGVKDNADMGIIPAGLYRNRDYVGDMFDSEKGIDPYLVDALFDPQTSGGMLITVDMSAAEKMVSDMREGGYEYAAVIGHIEEAPAESIKFLKKTPGS